MNEIIISNSNGKLTVSSLQVAKDFGKEHRNVTQAIENLTAENSAVKKFFTESTYINERGRAYKCYEMTKDGFSLLVMGFTGKKALEWKLRYIEAFNLMEQKLYSDSYKQLSFDDVPKYEYFDKTYKGEPVLTVEDISHIIGVTRHSISYYLGNKSLKRGCDYYTLRAGTIRAFKKENPKISDKITCLTVVVKSGFVKLCEILGIKCDIPDCYRIEEKERPERKIISAILKDFDIEAHKLTRKAADILGYKNMTITGNSILLHDASGKNRDMIFYDNDSDYYEKLAAIMKNVGHLLLGGFRESKDGKPILEDEINEESRIFSAVFLALKLFADYGGFDTNK